MNKRLLEGLKIIDLSHRLPGPLCGKILSDLGAEVIKIEDVEFKDPFLSGLFAQFDSSFIHWYEELNSNKKVQRFDFNSSEDIEAINKIIMSSDAIIMGLPPKTRTKLKLDDQNLLFKKPFVVLELLASKEGGKSLHDLNALAESGLLSMHVSSNKENIIAPPLLPISGITFGHKGATDLISGLLKANKIYETVFVKTFLDESTENILGIFWPKKDRALNRTEFLHNGKYPCYNIYKTKDDKYIALAAVEEKYWNRFCELFNIDKNINRFEIDNRNSFELIAKSIQQYSSLEIAKLIQNEDICLSMIK
jgi:crotonobetainyl-CoA:carnitine CoA-transferase CaiB-like acyl-CoA transferase